MAVASYYPPSPPDVPVDLTELTPAYRQRVVLVLLSIIVFLILYFGLIFLSGWLAYKLFTWPTLPGQGVLWVVRIIAAVPCTLLFLFLVKNLLKWSPAEKSYDIEIFPDEHPRLFDFIERLCEETGAPPPRRVFVNFEVNGFASYNISLFHLFVPAAKNLTIGLGLVNAINLTEFKAFLAHEFGHISQKSMKLGSYVYSARRIISDLVYGYDFFDRFIDGWRSLDVRLSWPAWMFYGILWTLRKFMGGMLEGIFYLGQSLSRQMEFNADLVAVSVAGSDAPVHLLYKSWFGECCLRQAELDLRAARDHDLLSSDVFYHQNKAADFVRRKAKDPHLGEPPPLPADPRATTRVFKPDHDEQAGMWAAHPADYDREKNAKYDYVRTAFDERTPWILFDNMDELRERVTVKFYRFCYRAPRELLVSPPEVVQEFIDGEHAETTYDPKYQGLYDARNLLLGDLGELAAAKTGAKDVANLAQIHAGLYGVEVKHRAQLYNRRNQDAQMLLAIANGWEQPKNGEFEFRGEWYRKRDAKRLLKMLERELEEDETWLGQFDRKVFETYYQLALQLNSIWATELFRRYEFHLALQDIWKKLRTQDHAVGGALAFLNQATGPLHPEDFRGVMRTFRDAQRELKASLAAAENMRFPPLKNMPAGQSLRPFLLDKKLVASVSVSQGELRGKWVDKFLKQFHEVQTRIDRLHFKSLGAILALQENIGATALERSSPVVQRSQSSPA